MRRILIVDDSATMRRMVAASLRNLQDVLFEEASSGLEAIERLSLNPASLMILDLNMPDMHGLDVLKFVRAQQSSRNLPIIILTTRDDQESPPAAFAQQRDVVYDQAVRTLQTVAQCEQFIGFK